MNSQRFRTYWLWASLFGLMCTILAYGVHWRRGPHHDDYFLYSWSFQQLVDHFRYEVRPIGNLFAAVVFSQPEAVGRVTGAAMLIGTSLLSGLLLYRLFGIRLAAAASALFCLVPFAGVEATTWTSAVVRYMPAGFFAMAALNLFLSALREVERPRRRRLLALLSGFVLALSFGSMEPSANFYILFLGLLGAEMHVRPEDSGKMLRSLAWATLVIVLLGSLIYITLYIGAGQVTRRGVYEIPSFERIVSFIMGFHQRGFGGTFGQDIIRISFREGWESLRTNHFAALVMLAAAGSAVGLNLTWKTQTVQKEQTKSVAIRLGIIMAACLLTTIASLLLPSVLLSNESGSPRLAYLPGVSGTLFIACCIAQIATFLRVEASQRIILAMISLSVLVLSVYLLGYTRMYQLRNECDRLQVAALLKAVPREAITGRDITFLPFDVYENFLGYHTNTNPKFILIGGFSSPNSIGTILERAYPQTRVKVIRPRYGESTWGIDIGNNRTLRLSGYEGDQPQEVRADDLILFRFCGDATVELAEMIQFIDSRGTLMDTVTLPWAIRLQKNYGTRTFILRR